MGKKKKVRVARRRRSSTVSGAPSSPPQTLVAPADAGGGRPPSALADDAIAGFYRQHPYPRVASVWLDRNLLTHFHYLAGTCPQHVPGRPLRVLVAGAGTTEALTWALSLPAAQIHAVDLSPTSLAIAGRLAAQLGIRNLELRHADFAAGEGLDGLYDVVSCLGVLHHLESPARGLAVLERHLAPGGLMVLMVYTETHRRLIEDAQRVIARLTRGLTGDARAAAARRIVDHARLGPGRLSATFQIAHEDAELDPPSFADTMLNPREVSYTIPQLVALLAGAGLELVSPTTPLAWRTHHLLSAEDQAAADALPLPERLEVADLLRSPVGSFLVRRQAERVAPRPCRRDRALLWQTVPRPVDAGAFLVHALVVDPNFQREDVVVEHTADGAVLYRTPRHRHAYHPLALEVLRSADGRRTLGELTAAAAAALGLDITAHEAELAELLAVLVDDHALLTPDVAQCTHCPARAAAQSART